MRSNQRDILEQRVKFIAKRRNVLVTELEELDVEAQELVITLRVLDRYAIRLAGTKGKTTKGPEPEEEEDEEEAEAQPAAEPVQPETPAPAPETPAEPETPPSEAGPAENGIYKPLAEALQDPPVIKAVEEAVIIQVKPDVLDMLHSPAEKPQPPLAQPEPFNVRKKVEPVDLRKGVWTPERVAEASRAARENWAKRKGGAHSSHARKYGTKEPDPETIQPNDETVEETRARIDSGEPIFNRKAGLQPPKIEPADKTQARELARGRKDGTYNKDTSGQEPPPAWRGKPAEPPDRATVEVDGKTVALVGSYIMFDGKIMGNVDKWERAVLETLIKGFGQEVPRKDVRNMVKDIDKVIGELRAKISVTPVKIDTCMGRVDGGITGWKLCPRSGGKT